MNTKGIKRSILLLCLFCSLIGKSQVSISSTLVANKGNGKEKVFVEGDLLICYYKGSNGKKERIAGRYCKWGDNQIQFGNEILELKSIMRLRKNHWYLRFISIPCFGSIIYHVDNFHRENVYGLNKTGNAVAIALSAIAGSAFLYANPGWYYNPHYPIVKLEQR